MFTWRTLGLAVTSLGLLVGGCADKEADHFLGALKRADYAEAFSDLHPEARARTPSAEALKAAFVASNVEISDFGWNCGSSSTSLKRSAYNVTWPTTAGKPRTPLAVGTPIERRGRCNGPLVIELKRDESAPGKPWKVAGMKFD